MAATAPPAGVGELKQNIPLGIVLMLLGFLMFAANDALGKWLAETYSPFQILLFRSIAAGLFLVPFVIRDGIAAMFALEQRGLHVLRIVFATAEVFCFYWAVSGLPLADCMTFYLAGPIYVTVLAAVVLKEHVGWRRWTAVGIGFVGVLIALRPSTGAFTIHSAIALVGSLLYAGFLVTTRSLRKARDLPMAGWQVIGALLLGAAGAPFQWTPIGHSQDVILLGLLGVTALTAIVCVNRSLKLAPASVVVPYQYTLIVWAVLFGYFVFGDVPSWNVLAGAAIIVAAGLFIFFREQVVVDEAKAQVSPGP